MTAFFTGLNNLKIISILDEKYDEHFGFTDEEVQKICDDYQMSQKFETMKEWYNGYLFGNANVYNPWSVIQFMDDLQDNFSSAFDQRQALHHRSCRVYRDSCRCTYEKNIRIN